MEDFYRILETLEKGQKRAVLATIIDVKGSSYRKVGTSMLMAGNGQTIGVLSGGCLEMDLKARADRWFAFRVEEFEELNSEIISYDLRSEEENAWGRGSGCNGIMTVLIEPVTSSFRHQLHQVKLQMDRGLSAVSLRIIDKEHCQRRAFIFDDGRVIGDHNAFKEIIKDTPFHAFREIKKPNIVVITHRIRPRLVIFGAGDDAMPLTELAAKTGWAVVVADWRAAYCNHKRFPMAEICHVGIPQDLLLGITECDSVIIMTHDFKIDQFLLNALMKRELAYLAVLGPQERTKRLIKGSVIPETVHSPAGLSIEADGPEEIAVSIMAEVIKEYHHAAEKLGVMSGC